MGCTLSSKKIDIQKARESIDENDQNLKEILESKYQLSPDDETFLVEKLKFHAYLLSLISIKPHIKKEYFNGDQYFDTKEFFNFLSSEQSYCAQNNKIIELKKENAELKYRLENGESEKFESGIRTSVNESFFLPSFNIIETHQGILFLIEISYLDISKVDISIKSIASKKYHLNIDAKRSFELLRDYQHFLTRIELDTNAKVDFNFETSKDIDVRNFEPKYEDGILKFLVPYIHH